MREAVGASSKHVRISPALPGHWVQLRSQGPIQMPVIRAQKARIPANMQANKQPLSNTRRHRKVRGWLRGGDPCGTSPFSRTAPSPEAVGEAAVRPSRGKTPRPAKILSPGGSGRGFVEGGKLHLRLCPPSLPGPWVNSVHRVKVSWPPLAMIPVSTPPCPFSVVAHHHHHHHHLSSIIS